MVSSYIAINDHASVDLSRSRFWLIISLSILSIIILTHQSVEYYKELSCCNSTNPEIIRAFREYGTFLGIPISIIGILQMMVTISLLVILTNPIMNQQKNQRLTETIYYLLLIELMITSVIVINLIIIELVIIKSFCLLCTITQMVIMSNTVLVYLWEPMGETEDNREKTKFNTIDN